MKKSTWQMIVVPFVASLATIDATVLKDYKKITRVFIYTDAIESNNVSNLVCKAPLKIGSNYIIEFTDIQPPYTFLFFPNRHNIGGHTHTDLPAEGLQLTGKFRRYSGSPTQLKILLKLEN